jgi:hypothetical protein
MPRRLGMATGWDLRHDWACQRQGTFSSLPAILVYKDATRSGRQTYGAEESIRFPARAAESI